MDVEAFGSYGTYLSSLVIVSLLSSWGPVCVLLMDFAISDSYRELLSFSVMKIWEKSHQKFSFIERKVCFSMELKLEFSSKVHRTHKNKQSFTNRSKTVLASDIPKSKDAFCIWEKKNFSKKKPQIDWWTSKLSLAIEPVSSLHWLSVCGHHRDLRFTDGLHTFW